MDEEPQIDPRNKLNALTGREWIRFTKSLIKNSLIKNTSDFNLTFEGETIATFYQWNENENQTTLIVPDASTEYYLTIWVQDISEQWIVYRYHYVVDNNPPSITGIIPLNKVKLGQSIEFNCSEKVYSLIYKWNNEVNFTTILFNGTNDFILAAPEKIGNHSINLWISDQLGNEGEYEIDFIVEKSQVQIQREFFGLITGTTLLIGLVGVLAVGTVIAYKKGFLVQG